MGNVVQFPRRRKPEEPKVTAELLRGQIASLTAECADRVELLEGLPHVFAKLVEIVPTTRRAELSRSLCYLTHELDLTAHNLRVVLICAMVLADRYTAENAA
jgi:hypothetical protein